MARQSLLLPFIAVALLATAALADMRTFQLGDMDGIGYDGPGSVDHVYVDPDLLALLQSVAPSEPNDDFDVVNINNNVPFTFLFPLAPGEEIVAATLTFGLRATDSLVTTDWLVLHDDDTVTRWVYRYSDLDWLPLPFTGSNVRTTDLADIVGDNRLPILQDGKLDIHITDDTVVDYATLEIDVIPAPSAALLGLIGLGMMASIRGRIWQLRRSRPRNARYQPSSDSHRRFHFPPAPQRTDRAFGLSLSAYCGDPTTFRSQWQYSELAQGYQQPSPVTPTRRLILTPRQLDCSQTQPCDPLCSIGSLKEI